MVAGAAHAWATLVGKLGAAEDRKQRGAAREEVRAVPRSLPRMEIRAAVRRRVHPPVAEVVAEAEDHMAPRVEVVDRVPLPAAGEAAAHRLALRVVAEGRAEKRRGIARRETEEAVRLSGDAESTDSKG